MYAVLGAYSRKTNMLCVMFFHFQYRVLIYASKQQQVTTGKIHGNFSFTVIFIGIYVNSIRCYLVYTINFDDFIF